MTNRSFVQFEEQYYISGTIQGPQGTPVPVYQPFNYPVLTTEVMLRKALSGNIDWVSSKSTISISLADINYEYQTSNNNERTQSGEATWQWRTSQTMAFSLSGYYRQRKTSPADRSESIDRLEMKLSRTIFPGARTIFSVASTNRNSDVNTEDYSQKRFTLTINMTW